MIDPKKLQAEILVCVPTFNATEGLATTLESIMAQDHQDFAVLVSDNASTDNTRHIVEGFQKKERGDRIFLSVNEENIGRLENWNKCLEIFAQSKCQYLKMVFAGDELEAKCLRVLSGGFRQYHDRPGLAVSGYTIRHPDGYDENYPRLGKTQCLGSIDGLKLFVEKGNWVGAPIACLFKKEAIATHRFDVGLEWAADWKFCVDIVNFHDVVYIDGNIGKFNIRHRKHFLREVYSHKARREELMVKQYALSLVEDRDPKLASSLYRYIVLTEGKIAVERLSVVDFVKMARDVVWWMVFKLLRVSRRIFSRFMK